MHQRELWETIAITELICNLEINFIEMTKVSN